MNNIQALKNIEFEQREQRLKNASKEVLKYKKKDKNYLNITYVMTWTGICGGSKIIFEHANRLVEKGHKITIISHDNEPTWYKLNEKVDFMQIPYGEILCESIPEDSDIIVATYWREIYECVEQRIAPVVYFEQGDFHLFDIEKLDKRTFKYIDNQLKTINYIYTVSNFAKQKLEEIYGVKNINVIPNAVDERIFYYVNHKENKNINITLIGAEQSKFKRIENIIEAIKIIKEKGYKIKVNWITPICPEVNKDINAIVNPPQILIGDILRNSDIYICASMYESFCLPVLEAMTCGAAIITTNNGGNMDFVKDNFNALVIEKDNINDIVEKVEKLIKFTELRKNLVKN